MSWGAFKWNFNQSYVNWTLGKCNFLRVARSIKTSTQNSIARWSRPLNFEKLRKWTPFMAFYSCCSLVFRFAGTSRKSENCYWWCHGQRKINGRKKMILAFDIPLFNYRLLLCDSCCKAISFTLVIFAIATFAHDLPLNLRLIQKVRCDYGTIPNLINPFCHWP